jgi:hypothetical protein
MIHRLPRDSSMYITDYGKILIFFSCISQYTRGGQQEERCMCVCKEGKVKSIFLGVLAGGGRVNGD